MFVGSMTALVTPMRNGAVDEEALRQLVERQIAAGIDGLVPCGTTGESPTLSPEEHRRIITIVVQETRKRVPVIAGAGSNSTSKSAELAQAAREAGADGILVVTPYYNKPTQEGLYRHFAFVAEKARLPVVLYNVPGRTGCDLLPDTVARLAEIPGIVAIKEATGSVARTQEILQRVGDRLVVLSGDDGTCFPAMCVGARGVISVTSNVVPDRMAALWDAVRSGDFDRARSIHNDLLSLHEAMFLESNPIPVKAALAMMGLIAPEIRLPLVPLSERAAEKLRAVLRAKGLLAV